MHANIMANMGYACQWADVQEDVLRSKYIFDIPPGNLPCNLYNSKIIGILHGILWAGQDY